MMKTLTNKVNSLRFRRWSRKGYAVFVSMTCVVTIGVLAISVCEKLEVKSMAGNVLKNETVFLTAEEDEILRFEEVFTDTDIATFSSNHNEDAAACGQFKYFINPNG